MNGRTNRRMHPRTNADTASQLPSTADRRGPLIVTGDESLLDDLLRLCAAAGTEPEVVFAASPPAVSWEDAPLVLVGTEASGWAGGAPRRKDVLLVGRDQDDAEVWRQAVGIGADHVLILPDAETWLVDRLADVAEGVGEPALTVGVLGGRGGAGASTLACALAVTAARSGRRAMLVDGDPSGVRVGSPEGADRGEPANGQVTELSGWP